MKKLALSILFIAFALQAVFAQEHMYVTADRLSLRSTPELSGDNVIKALQYGDVVEFLTHSGAWAKVRHQGSEGYVPTEHLSHTTPQRSGARQDENVLICNSINATVYHSRRCNGLARCSHSISEVRVSEAVDLGRRACGICYPGSAPSRSNQAVTPTPRPPSGSGCPTVQCSGTTKSGARCRNRTTKCSGRCYHHG